MQHEHAPRTYSRNMQHGNSARYVSRISSIDMYGQVPCTRTCSMGMHMRHGHAAWTCSIDMQHGHAGWTCSKNIHQEHAARLCSTVMQHGHAARKYSTDVQHEHAAWKCRMKNVTWLCSMDMQQRHVTSLSPFDAKRISLLFR
jgi:hypothetical protein